MTLVVWKFPVPPEPSFALDLPLEAEILHFGLDPQGAMSIWALVDPFAKASVERRFALLMTGEQRTDLRVFTSRDSCRVHIGTLVDRVIVSHLFEVA